MPRITLFVAVVAGLGYAAYSHIRENLIEAEGSKLLLIAQQKAEAVGTLLTERAQDAELLADRSSTRRLLAGRVTGASALDETGRARTALMSTARVYNYRRVMLLNRSMDVVLSATPDAALRANVTFAIWRAIQTGRPALVDFHFEDEQSKGRVLYGVVHPVFESAGEKGAAIGAVYLERDAALFIFPTVMRWPTNSRTTSAALFARSGDELVAVNPTREGESPLTLPFSANDAHLLSARVARSPGIARATDYRGVTVLGAGAPVPGTGMIVVTKMDLREAEAPLRAFGAVIVALGLAFSLGAAWILRNQVLLQRQRAAAEQAKLNERYAWLTRYANDMIFLTDDSGRIVEINERTESSYGYSRAELLQMNAADLRLPEKRAEVAQRLAELETRDSVIYRTEHLRKDGTRLQVEISMRAVEHDGARYVLAVARDISQLVERERFYNAAIEGSMDGFIVFDMSGNILEANHAVADLIGASVEELRGMRTRDFVLLARPFEAVVEDIRRSGSLRYDVPCRRKDGTILLVEASSTYVEVGEGVIFAFLRDVTDKREEEAKRRRTSQLYAFRGEISEMLLREFDLGRILETGCRIAVEVGGFRMAWAGIVDEVAREVRPVVHFGESRGYLDQLRISLGDDANGRGPTATALRDGNHVVCNDIESDPLMAPWRDAALERGYRASAAFPILTNGKTRALISLYADSPGYFGEFELHLLDELGLDIGIALDLNETQAALRTSEEHLLQAQAVGGVGSWAFDVNTGEFSGSAEAVRIFGSARPQLGAEDLLSRIHPDDLEYRQKHWRAALAGAPYESEYRLLIDGQVRWVNSRGRAQKGADGKVTKLIGVVQDVTERRRISAELEDYRLRLEEKVAERTRELEAANEKLLLASLEQNAIFDTAPGGIVLMRDRTILRCNARMDALFGYARGELIGKPTRIWYADDDAYAEVGREIAATLGRGEVHRREHHFVRKDGSRFWARMTGCALVAGDAAKGMVGIIEDITDERAAAVALREAKLAAEEAARAKADFLANMSHEIRTPMNAVIGLTHLVLKTALTARQRDYLGKIQGASAHLLGVINDILDFSKSEASKLAIERVEFDLDKLLYQVGILLSDRIGEKQIELVIDVAPDVPRRLVGDPLRLEQILLNYGSNAVKFTDAGEVQISGQVVERSDAGVKLRLAVRDTGIGLADTQKMRLFQSFQQADTSTTRKYGGTGLGLAIVKRLAGLMGGEVGVDSAPGVGSTFWCTVQLGVGTEQPRVLVPDPDLRGIRVLVVDDNDTARAILGDMLASMTFEVDAVASGAAAVAAVREAAVGDRPYVIVFLDWHMAEMDGIETAHRIAALGLDARPKLVMVTAYGREDVMGKASAAGIEGFLVKPGSPSLIFDTAIELLRGERDPAAKALLVAQQEVEIPAGIRGARILLVEDNELNQEVATELLSQAGFRVEVAGNGQVALDRVKDTQFDLVFMDMQMPVMDGLAATAEIRKLPERRDLPIIAMTANALPQDRERCLAAGMNDYIAKPIDPDQLIETLCRWIKPRPDVDTGARMDAARVAMTESPVRGAIPAGVLDGFAVPGLDVADGLRRVGGNPTTYVSLLRRFCQSQGTAAQSIREALDALDRPLAERLAHTVKGVAGTLGARDLQACAARLEDDVRKHAARADIEPSLASFGDMLGTLLAAIAARLPAVGQDAPAQAIDPARLEQVCDELAELLGHSDAAAGSVFATNKSLLAAAFPAEINAIEAAIHGFDFDAGHGRLDAARAARRSNAAPN